MTDHRLRIVEYSDDLADTFHAINAEWIEAMFVLEPHDIAVLTNPRAHIIDRGGAVLFVEDPALGIVGTCALMPSGKGGMELTKMGVLSSAQGRKAGEFLLQKTIERAQAIGVQPLFLLTHHSCEAAIHLYEKAGFVHDAAIMALHGAQYARCTVAMRYAGEVRVRS
jgi:N-acetylglutamate synthase-like GNAT family acetyltransferase